MAVAPAQVITESETNVAARSYMRDTGVSLETAKQRLQIESELPPFIAKLRERYRDRVAFISVESQPDQHLVVGLKGMKMQPSQRINVGASMIRVEFEEGYPYTEAEFEGVMKAAIAKVTALIPDATSVDGFPELNLIKVGVQGTDKESYLPAIKEVEEVTGLKVELVLGEQPFRNSAYTRGGAILQSNGSTCTSGLAVRHKVTKEKGLITAAHCEDNLMYSNHSQTVGGPQVLIPLIFKDGLFDGSHDVQWHSLPAGSSPLQEVFAAGQGEYQGKALLLIYGGSFVAPARALVAARW